MKPEEVKHEDVVTTNCYKISRDKHGIIHRELIKDSHITIEEVKRCEEISLALSGSEKMLVLVDARQFHTMTPEAFEGLQVAHDIDRIATAIVSNNLSEKITVDFVKETTKKTVEVFSSKEEALKWLLSHKEGK